MNKKTKIAIAKKDLFMDDGEHSFTKGKEYAIHKDSQLIENILLIDNQNDPHQIGNVWKNHFKFIYR